MSTEPSDSEIVHAAIDALLLVVSRSSDDLRAFHATVSKAREGEHPPFPPRFDCGAVGAIEAS